MLTADGGTQALELAARHEGAIDLLVSDVVMPGMLGKELAERLVDVRPDTRVLYMSGYAQPVLASQGTLDPGWPCWRSRSPRPTCSPPYASVWMVDLFFRRW